MKHKSISIIFISFLIIAILLMMSPRMLAYTIPTVENLKVEYSDGTANLSWSSVTNADGYEVFVNIPGYGYVNIGSVSQNKVSVIGISEGTAYSVKVRAYEYVNNIKEVGSFSNEIDFDTNKEADLDKVTGLEVNVKGNIATVNWKEVSNATGYEVYVDIPNYGYLKIGSVSGNAAILTGFQVDGKYAVKVRAYKGTNGKDGYGDFSASKTFYIDSEDFDDDKKIELDQVTGLDYELDKDKVYLDWKKVTNADEYIVYISINNSSYNEIGRVTNNNATINSLKENTTYKVKVVAYNEDDDVYGKESKVITFKTDKDFEDKIDLGKVTNLTVDVEGNKAYLDWKKVTDTDEYEVYLSKNNGSYKLIGTVKTNNATISDLDYNTSYKVKVRAYNKEYKEYGAYSDIKSFKTDKKSSSSNNNTTTSSKVAKVTNVTSSVTGSSVYLSWKSVPGAVKYEIQFTVPGYGGSTTLWSEGPGRTISGITTKNADYTAKVRAYKYVNGKLVAGEYSDVVKFRGK